MPSPPFTTHLRAAMTQKTKFLSLALLLALCLALALPTAQARHGGFGGARLPRRSLLVEERYPGGWTHALRIAGGRFCSLLHFPPLPDGYGTAKVLCSAANYNNYWLWKLEKVSGSGAIVSGDQVYLKIFNPMLSYCRLKGTEVECGVQESSATAFTITKGGAAGAAINFATDSVYLRAGSNWCNVRGSKKSARLRCDRGKQSDATALQLPSNSLAQVSIINSLSSYACGSDFFTNSPVVYANCSKALSSNFETNFTISVKTPGAFAISNGTSVAFKVHDELYRYQFIIWRVDDQQRVYAADDSTTGTSQWLVLEKISGSAGAVLASGDLIAVRSEASGLYCGIATVNGIITCDRAASGGVSALPAGYTYTYTVSA